RTAFRVQREHSVWHNADAQTERDKIDNQVEVVGLHRGFDSYSVACEPASQSFAGAGVVADEQPALPTKDFCQRLRRNSSPCSRQPKFWWREANELVLETMRDGQRS